MNPQSSAALRFGQRTMLSGEPGFDLESLDTHDLPNTCQVDVSLAPLVPDIFLLVKTDSTTVPDGVDIIAPVNGPGRWFRYSFLHPGSESCPTVFTVNTLGTGDYATPFDALVAANAAAGPGQIIVVSLCPGVYVIGATLPISNPFVSLKGDAPGCVFLTAAPGVTPLLEVSAPGSPTTKVALTDLELVRSDDGDLLHQSGMILVVAERVSYFGVAGAVRAVAMTAGIYSQQQGSVILSDVGSIGFSTSGGKIIIDLTDVALDIPGGAFGNLASNTGLTLFKVNGSASTGWSMPAPGSGYMDRECNLSVGDQTALLEFGGSGFVFVRNSVWNAGSASAGLLCNTAQNTPNVTFDDVEWTGTPLSTFINLSNNALCHVRDCRAGGGCTPIALAGTAQVIITDGQIDIDSCTGLTIANSRWQTSGNGDLKNGMDVSQGSEDGELQARQVMVRVPFTPVSTADARGDAGNWAWDDTGLTGCNFYIKTATGWYKVPLIAF